MFNRIRTRKAKRLRDDALTQLNLTIQREAGRGVAALGNRKPDVRSGIRVR